MTLRFIKLEFTIPNSGEVVRISSSFKDIRFLVYETIFNEDNTGSVWVYNLSEKDRSVLSMPYREPVDSYKALQGKSIQVRLFAGYDAVGEEVFKAFLFGTRTKWTGYDYETEFQLRRFPEEKTKTIRYQAKKGTLWKDVMMNIASKTQGFDSFHFKNDLDFIFSKYQEEQQSKGLTQSSLTLQKDRSFVGSPYDLLQEEAKEMGALVFYDGYGIGMIKQGYALQKEAYSIDRSLLYGSPEVTSSGVIFSLQMRPSEIRCGRLIALYSKVTDQAVSKYKKKYIVKKKTLEGSTLLEGNSQFRIQVECFYQGFHG